MKVDDFVVELQSGRADLANQLSQCESEIERLKSIRKQLRLKVANQDGAIASALRINEFMAESEDEVVAELDVITEDT